MKSMLEEVVEEDDDATDVREEFLELLDDLVDVLDGLGNLELEN